MSALGTLDRPALRYFGGKWRLAPWLIEHFPPHACYVEPFGGGASVLLQKGPSPVEVYNDADREVVTFFRVLRERTGELLRAIELTPVARAELALACEPATDELEIARRFYVRSWQGRGARGRDSNTSWRYHRDAERRRSVTEEWNRIDHLWAVVARLKQVHLEYGAYAAVIERFDSPDTLFYCDPPYPVSTRSRLWAGRGYAVEMTDDDHRRLAGLLHGIRGMALVSSYPSALYDDLYGDWRRVTCRARTDGPTLVERTETLWLSPAAVERGRQLWLFDGEMA